MDLGLTDKPALVLASSGGIGKGIAAEFAREGARVMLFARSKDNLEATQAEIEQATGNKPAVCVGDVTRSKDIERGVAATVAAFGSVYTLVNNTGGPPAGPFTQFNDDDWTAAFELTLLSYVRSIRAVLPIMEQAGGGRIVNNASSSLKNAIDNLLLSNVFRMGVAGLSKTLAREFGAQGILVNVVGAGKIATDRIESLDAITARNLGITHQETQSRSQGEIPLGRYGTIEEFAKLAVFLGSPANTYVTGQSILIDGGLITTY